MNFLQRACLYCVRQRIKTLILFLMFTVVFTLLLDSLAIRDASGRAAVGVQTGMGGKLILEIDTEGNFGNEKENSYGTSFEYIGDYVTQPMIDAVSKVEGVVDYNVEDYAAAYFTGVSFQYIPTSYQLSLTKYGDNASYTACLSSERCSAFESGKYTLIDGRHIRPDDSYALLISKELADYNGIRVGDIVKVYSYDLDVTFGSVNPFAEMEIVGIYNGTEGTATGGEILASQLQANCGFVAYNTLFDMYAAAYENGAEYLSVTVYVNDPTEIQKVYDEIKALPEIQGKTLKLGIVNEEYQTVELPLETLRGSVNAAIIIITFTGFVVLTLFLTLCIRGRKREIGILLSVGTSKASIVFQFLTEAFVSLLASFLLSILLSNLTAAKVSRFLLSEIADGSANPIVKVSAKYLLPMCCIGFLLAALSVVASSRTIYRLKPKDILTKMS